MRLDSTTTLITSTTSRKRKDPPLWWSDPRDLQIKPSDNTVKLFIYNSKLVMLTYSKSFSDLTIKAGELKRKFTNKPIRSDICLKNRMEAFPVLQHPNILPLSSLNKYINAKSFHPDGTNISYWRTSRPYKEAHFNWSWLTCFDDPEP